MGKPHSVKEEQKNEEERLKSKNIYFFIGNSRLGIYRNLFEPIGNRKKKHCLIYLHGVFIQLWKPFFTFFSQEQKISKTWGKFFKLIIKDCNVIVIVIVMTLLPRKIKALRGFW